MLDVCLLGTGGMMPLPRQLADCPYDKIQWQQPSD